MATKTTTDHPITIADEAGAAVLVADAAGAARTILSGAEAIGHIVRIVRVHLDGESDEKKTREMFLAAERLINEALVDVTCGAEHVTSFLADMQEEHFTRPLTYNGAPAHIAQGGAR